MPSHYEVLGVAETATPEDLKAAYRRIARQDHPDRNPGNRHAEDRFKAASVAYSTLSDPAKRAAYDRDRRAMTWRPYVDAVDLLFRQQSIEYSYSLALTVQESVVGALKRVQVGTGTYELEVPPGTIPGTRVTVRKGRWAAHFDITAAPDDKYELVGESGHDVLVRKDVPYHVLVMGGPVNVAVPGGVRSIWVPPMSRSGIEHRYRHEGCPWANVTRPRGDLIIRLEVAVPEHSAEQLRLLAEYARAFEQAASEDAVSKKKRRRRFF